ncbi:hybrid sensor histidine kinase/response regulator [Ktedonosporobacter rubrisoli]|uniref:histidine kinase n=1 Tax=Ktedonosporobacter rubrisoli TaxID=2509675 RepID=A0A4P6JXX6_KTERU|nr:response regulator [Ktedonosporobacter rubrisoli]QBD80524.1 hybrid sensor histidine kinase/response regulator [Ktedonosporobacter rubrisoli]
MNEIPFDENELSADDLAVLRAFEAMEDWDTDQEGAPPASPVWSGPPTPPVAEDDQIITDDMLILFASEAADDISKIKQTLGQLEQEVSIEPARFVTLKRAAHKIRGTSGTIEYHVMAKIAQHIEEVSEKATEGQILPPVALQVLRSSLAALEQTLEGIVERGQEDTAPLAALEQELQQLSGEKAQPVPSFEPLDPFSGEAAITPSVSRTLGEIPASASSASLIRVDAQRLERLVQHTEQLTVQRAALENAQQQLNTLLQDLQAAQTHLQQLEPQLLSCLSKEQPAASQRPHHPISSLVARILNEAAQQGDVSAPRKSRSRYSMAKTGASQAWDELDMERYNEKDMLVRSLTEAIADVAVVYSRAHTSFARFNSTLQNYMALASAVRNDTLLLRLAPLSTLVPRLQRVVAMSALAQERQVEFNVTGDSLEIDQDMLEALTNPLLQLMRSCTADLSLPEGEEVSAEPYHIWLHAQSVGNEITLEVGFSMAVPGGVVDAIRDSIQDLNGTIFTQRNVAGGISFHLRLPHAHSASHCLLVRTGTERIIIPFSQVQRISDGKQEKLDILYNLNDLLGFSHEADGDARIQPVLILPQGISRIAVGISIDEVLGEAEMVVKPLVSYMQRPGIAGAAVDGNGDVLLMVDLPELIRHYTVLWRNSSEVPRPDAPALAQHNSRPKILVADDSVYLRQSLLHTLRHANYEVVEARDGMEALEQLLESRPDIFLLDVEMPNLNGYDLLSIMRLYPELAGIKIIMLTSRSSEKHKKRALDLGAHVYLTKPCAHELLLQTIEEQLKR